MPNATYARTQGRNFRSRASRYRPPEVKWFNIEVNTPASVGNTLGATSTINRLLNPIPQGVSQSQRIGDQVNNRSIHMRLLLERGAVDSVCRVILFWSLDGAFAAAGPIQITNLLENPLNWKSPLNKDYGKSFWVRYDKTYTLAAGQSALQVDEIFRSLKCVTEYQSDASTDPSQNALYIAFISNQLQIADQPLVSFTTRVNYTDE